MDRERREYGGDRGHYARPHLGPQRQPYHAHGPANDQHDGRHGHHPHPPPPPPPSNHHRPHQHTQPGPNGSHSASLAHRGGHHHHQPQPQPQHSQQGRSLGGAPPKWHSFKMLVDPAIHRGAQKMVRYDGSIVPGNPHHVAPTPSDPRKRLPSALWRRLEPMELVVPRLRVDENYVGEPPKVEVTVENLNDNVDNGFLRQLARKHGDIEDVIIGFHPLTKKHLGLGRVIFVEVHSARDCVHALHGKSVMGKELTCYLDPNGNAYKERFRELTEEKKPEPEVESPATEETDGVGSRDPRDRHIDDKSKGWGRRNSRDLSRNNSTGFGDALQWPSGDAGECGMGVVAPPPPPPPPPPPIAPTQSNDGSSRNSSDAVAPSGSIEPGYQQSQFDPQYSQPEYWLKQAQHYAAAAASAVQGSEELDGSEGALDKSNSSVPPTPGPMAPQEGLMESAKNGLDARLASLPQGLLPVDNDDDEGEMGVEQAGEEPEEKVMDLDTRLKMLMRDKTGAMPAFLLDELNGSESEEDAEVARVNQVPHQSSSHPAPFAYPHNGGSVPGHFSHIPSGIDEMPLSRPPSPFLSSEHYMACHREWIAERRAEWELAKVRYALNAEYSGQHSSARGRRRPQSRNSDQMSLSSLSSADDKIEQDTPHPAFYQYPPPPGGSHWGGSVQPSHFHPHGQYPLSYAFDPSQLPPGYDYYRGSGQEWWGQAEQLAQPLDPKSNIGLVQKAVLDAFVEDLKLILRKDINKRMCETFAFIIYDKWWLEQENKFKNKKQQSKSSGSDNQTNSQSGKKSATPSESVPLRELASKGNSAGTSSTVPTAPKRAEDLISALFDKQREKLESAGSKAGGALGMGGSLGFRGTIPKLPSFKRSRSSRKDDRDRRREYSSDEENQPSGSARKSLDRRKDQERRRDKRRAHDQERREKSGREKGSSSKSTDSKSHRERGEKGDGLKSIHSLIYSSDDGEENSKSNSQLASRERSSSPEVQKKSSSKAVARRSSQETASHSSTSSSSDDEAMSPSASPSSSASSSESSSSSSSVSSESEEEEVAAAKAPTKTRAKRKLASASPSVSASGSSSSSSSSDDSGSSSSESDLGEVDVSGMPETPDVMSDGKKPLPRRNASVASPEAPLADDEHEAKGKASISDDTPPSHVLDHCYAKPVSEENEEAKNAHIESDHGYSAFVEKESSPTTGKPSSATSLRRSSTKAPSSAVKSVLAPRQTELKRQRAIRAFSPRDQKEDMHLLFKFLYNGVDVEDINYLKRSYEQMLLEADNADSRSGWLNETHWVDHSATKIPDPPKKRRRGGGYHDFSSPHLSGSCRTEGYYKMDPREKARTKYHLHRADAASDAFSRAGTKLGNQDGSVATKGGRVLQSAQSLSREARSAQRRQLAVLGDEVSSHSDLLKFNQLKFRRKQMIFGKSAIHDWGLFAMEDIGADEMVIEYVGHVIRPVVSDVWEKRYEKQGIGSSYLFRIDGENVVDATKKGNLARFINHSCDPNCYAKVITVDQQKKIVIYSKQAIAIGEEITYDYKFPIEDEKIHCLCGSRNCRKYLN